jgi:hypothetical protein
VLAAGGTVIILTTLAPLRTIVRMVFGGRGIDMELRVRLQGEGAGSALTTALAEREIGVRSLRRAGDEATIEITLPRRVTTDDVVLLCAELDDVELLDLTDDDD